MTDKDLTDKPKSKWRKIRLGWDFSNFDPKRTSINEAQEWLDKSDEDKDPTLDTYKEDTAQFLSDLSDKAQAYEPILDYRELFIQYIISMSEILDVDYAEMLEADYPHMNNKSAERLKSIVKEAQKHIVNIRMGTFQACVDSLEKATGRKWNLGDAQQWLNKQE